jgi:hypothetical protein
MMHNPHVYDAPQDLARHDDPYRDYGNSPKARELRRTDSEGLIPVSDDATLVYVIDCPELHVLDGPTLFPGLPLPGAEVSRGQDSK